MSAPYYTGVGVPPPTQLASGAYYNPYAPEPHLNSCTPKPQNTQPQGLMPNGWEPLIIAPSSRAVIPGVSTNAVGKNYRVSHKIGMGSFGEIYLGVDIRTNERVAIKVENRTTKYPQLLDEYAVYRSIAKGVGVPSAIWCFGEDTRVLTDQGFLFVDEIEKRIAAGESLKYASYEAKTKQYVYSEGHLVFPERPAGELLSFTADEEDARWDPRSNSYGSIHPAEDDRIQSNHLSLRVTPGHDMFVQVGKSGHCDGRNVNEELPSRKYKARTLFAKARDKNLRFCGVALNGAAGGKWHEIFDHLRAELGFQNEGQCMAFLGVYGFWLGDGSIEYNSLTTGCVVFNQQKDVDLDWLDDQLQCCGLRPGRDLTRGETDDGLAAIRVLSQRWFRYFDAEYGRMYKNSARYSNSNGNSYSINPTSLAAAAAPVPFESKWNEQELKTAYDKPVKSVKWLFWWALRLLNKDQCRAVVAGLHRADGAFKRDTTSIGTSSVEFRDALVVLLLHAGFGATFNLDCGKNAIRGYRKIGEADSHFYNADEIRGHEDQYQLIVAQHDHWSITWAEPSLESGKGAALPTISGNEIKREAYNGREWCIQVDHPDHLIVAQRAFRTPKGVVTKASRPIIVGNCGSNSNVHIMVMDLLGDSLESLYNTCGRKFSLKTITMLAIQLLHRIEHHHNHHYLHRDIKPDNFLMGPPQSNNSHILYMVDMGLCWGAGTPILMYDGRVKNVEYIKAGDIVMGDDATPRVVQHDSVHTGNTRNDRMNGDKRAYTYSIEPKDNMRERWTCNANHILVLRWNREQTTSHVQSDDHGDYYFDYLSVSSGVNESQRLSMNQSPRFFSSELANMARQEFLLTQTDVIECECSVHQFLNLPSHIQSIASMFQPASGVEFAPPAAPLRARLAHLLSFTQSPEHLLQQTARVIALFITRAIDSSQQICQSAFDDWLSLISLPAAAASSALASIIDSYGITHSCFAIPNQLLAEEKSIRMHLFAALIDCIGSYDSASELIELSITASSFASIRQDYVFLARSIGLVAITSTQSTVTFSNPHMHNIPTKVTHIRPSPSKQLDPITANCGSSFAFSVERVEDANYYGFTVDGNGRLLLADFNVTHNCKKYRDDTNLNHIPYRENKKLIGTPRYASINCFPSEDHQILTKQGFMFLHQVENHFVHHDTLDVACYVDGKIEYHAIEAHHVSVDSGSHRLIHIQDDASNIDICPTDNHRMYVQLTSGGNTDHVNSKFGIVQAGSIYDAGQLDSNSIVRFNTRAVGGVKQANQTSQSQLKCMQSLELHTLDQQEAYLQLYGYILVCEKRIDEHELVLLPRSSEVEFLTRSFNALQLPLLSSSHASNNFAIRHPLWLKHLSSLVCIQLESSKIEESIMEEASATDLLSIVHGLKQSHAHTQAPVSSNNSSSASSICTSSAEFRDDLTRVFLSAGFTTWTHFDAISQSYQVFYDSRSHYSEPVFPTQSACRVVSKPGTVWCVSVPTQEQLIFVRRVTHQCPKTGTILNASRPVIVGNTHLGIEQCRRDDLESIGYMLIYFFAGRLPWQGLKAKNKCEKYDKISQSKASITVADLCKGAPPAFRTYLEYTRQLRFTQKPDYKYLRSLFFDLFRVNGWKDDSLYDWMLPKGQQPEPPRPGVNGVINPPAVVIVPQPNPYQQTAQQVAAEAQARVQVNQMAAALGMYRVPVPNTPQATTPGISRAATPSGTLTPTAPTGYTPHVSVGGGVTYSLTPGSTPRATTGVVATPASGSAANANSKPPATDQTAELRARISSLETQLRTENSQNIQLRTRVSELSGIVAQRDASIRRLQLEAENNKEEVVRLQMELKQALKPPDTNVIPLAALASLKRRRTAAAAAAAGTTGEASHDQQDEDEGSAKKPKRR